MNGIKHIIKKNQGKYFTLCGIEINKEDINDASLLNEHQDKHYNECSECQKIFNQTKKVWLINPNFTIKDSEIKMEFNNEIPINSEFIKNPYFGSDVIVKIATDSIDLDGDRGSTSIEKYVKYYYDTYMCQLKYNGTIYKLHLVPVKQDHIDIICKSLFANKYGEYN